MKEALISIIVPIYNIEKYIVKCVESILGQTYRNLQIILVDDGSTDKSGKICDRYALQDSRIVVIHQKNGGVVKARKAGLKLAVGEYTGFADGDDYIEAAFYEHLLEAMDDSEVDFVHTGFINEKNDSRLICSPPYRVVITNSDDKMSLIKKHVIPIGRGNEVWYPAIWAKLFRTSFIRECFSCVPDNQVFGEDMIAFCRCILESRKFVLKPDAEYHYLFRNDSVSRKWPINRFWLESSLYNELCNIWKEYCCYEQMKDHMDKFLYLRMINCMNEINRVGLGTNKYVIPDINRLYGKRIVVYGAGTIGKNYISQILTQPQVTLVAWTDKKFQKTNHGLCVMREQLLDLQYDLILIALNSNSKAEDIKSELIEMGIEENKLLWIKPKAINLL